MTGLLGRIAGMQLSLQIYAIDAMLMSYGVINTVTSATLRGFLVNRCSYRSNRIRRIVPEISLAPETCYSTGDEPYRSIAHLQRAILSF